MIHPQLIKQHYLLYFCLEALFSACFFSTLGILNQRLTMSEQRKLPLTSLHADGIGWHTVSKPGLRRFKVELPNDCTHFDKERDRASE